MGVGHVDARQHAGKPPEGRCRQSPDIPERVDRDARGLRPALHRPVAAEGDQGGLHTPGAGAPGEVHHQSLQATDLEAVDDVRHFHETCGGKVGALRPGGRPGGFSTITMTL